MSLLICLSVVIKMSNRLPYLTCSDLFQLRELDSGCSYCCWQRLWWCNLQTETVVNKCIVLKRHADKTYLITCTSQWAGGFDWMQQSRRQTMDLTLLKSILYSLKIAVKQNRIEKLSFTPLVHSEHAIFHKSIWSNCVNMNEGYERCTTQIDRWTVQIHYNK